ncbi:DNA-deoxyinosine glycosylase [Bacillus sp. 1P06AnD]|uniref:DNA-deoxyinosine glycosylase n=1 Tax=Bacillus sp. 1P06AnD TaxID=3132208 RepID=UPI0039A03786
MTVINSMQPISAPDAKVLILGSMPGEISIQKQQYYGNGRNHFWPIVYSLFDEPLEEDYRLRVEFALRHRLALWDVIGSCRRKGSLDSSIREEVPNKLIPFIKQHPQLKLILFNGTKAFATFKKYFGNEPVEGIGYMLMPSTSPTPGKYNKTYEEKLECWHVIKDYMYNSGNGKST